MFIEGRWYCKVYSRNRLVYTLEPQENTFVIGIADAIAYMLRNRQVKIYHAFGEGDSNWDISPPPEPDVFTTQMQSEFYRQEPNNVDFVKVGFGKAIGGDANTILDPRRVESGKLVGRTEPDDFFSGSTVVITAGTNVGLSRTIASNTRSSGALVASSPFPAPVDNTTEYQILPTVISTQSNSIRIRTLLDFGDSSSPFNNKDIREEAIFMGNATSTLGSGFMINLIRHPKIRKDPTVRLERLVYLTFRI